MNTYRLIMSGDYAQRSDNTIIPWDIKNDRPLDMGGLIARQWVEDGSPASLPYIPPPTPVPEVVSEYQFMRQLASQGDITWDECFAYLGQGVIPQVFADAIAKIPTDQDVNAQNEAKAAFIGANNFYRHSPITEMLGQLIGKDDQDLDTLWTKAAAI